MAAKGTCSVAGCDQPATTGAGLCKNDYERQRLYGTTTRRPRGRKPTPALIRVLRGVSFPVAQGDCWLWQGGTTSAGYVTFCNYVGLDGRKRMDYGHRITYEQLRGPIPAGLVLDHLCCVRHCVNPWHLEAVTQAENNQRTIERGRRGG